MSEHVHTYPVDLSLTPREAWDEIRLMHRRTTFTGGERWANYVCDGIECQGIEGW